jgi:hypothetical protein
MSVPFTENEVKLMREIVRANMPRPRIDPTTTDTEQIVHGTLHT